MKEEKLIISPSELGEYVNQNQSNRFIKLRNHGENEEKSRNWKEAFRPLEPILVKEGNDFEDEVYSQIRDVSDKIVETWNDHEKQESNNKKIKELVKEAKENSGDQPISLFQAKLAGDIGEFYVPGDTDLVLIWPGNPVRVQVFDLKASWEEKTYHQIQTSCYTILIDRILDDLELDYILESGIIHKDTEFDTITPEELPTFENSSRENDVKRLLSDDGPLLDTYKKPLDEVEYQIDNVTRTSPYNESAFVDSIEEEHIRLLGLTRGEQYAFKEKGLETLTDIAELTEPLDNPRPIDYEDVEIIEEYRSKVRELKEDYGIQRDMVQLSQLARGLLERINPDHENVDDKPWSTWIHGAGKGNLPDDNPPYGNIPYAEETMIRVYMNLQEDYVNDIISLSSARITCGKLNERAETVSNSISEVHDTKEKMDQEESEMLETFFENLFSKIKEISERVGAERAPIHFYFYTNNEKELLIERLDENTSRKYCSLMRDLLDLDKGQYSMYSVVQKDIENRLVPKQVSTGLLPIYEQTYNDGPSKLPFNEESWSYIRESDGKSINLRQAFRTKIFDYSVPFVREDTGVEFLYSNQDVEPDGFYPLLGRFDASIPLEYLWGTKEINEIEPEWTDNPGWQERIKSYMYVDRDGSERVHLEDVEKLSEKFCHVLHHIERSMKYKNLDIEKTPLDLTNIDAFTQEEGGLPEACIDYMDLEYHSEYNEALEHYKKSLENRVLTGKSIPIEITEVEMDNGLMRASGKAIYNKMNFEKPERIARASRIKGSSDGSSGDRLVATPLNKTRNGLTDAVSKPEKILKSPTVSVERYDPRTGEIELLSFPSSATNDDSYRNWHRGWTLDDPGKYNKQISPGDMYVLDPQLDGIVEERAKIALENSSRSHLNEIIDTAISGETIPNVNLFEDTDIEEYLNWVEENHKPAPNERQKDYIKEINSKVSLLQGPPGTGKTSGALSNTIVSRLVSGSRQSKQIRGLVSGASNKSIDEVLEDVAEIVNKYKESENSELDNTMLVRLTNSEPENSISNVHYVDYYEDEEIMDRITNRLTSDEQQEIGSSVSPRNIIVFATPGTVFNLTKSFIPGVDPEGVYQMGMGIFELLAIDEASMMPLPQLYLCGGMLSKDSQILLSGDQRQMPPVQKHEWEEETRQSIRKYVPYLSSLDYFRFLRGEELKQVDYDYTSKPNAEIPITKLRETYRCHTTVSSFLQRWIYSKDDIKYHSSMTHTIPEVETENHALNTILDRNHPLVLVLHDDTSSQQTNISEALIGADIVENIPDSESIGLVTPHNAQKGLLKSLCSEDSHVDTVERFQGGQRDAMIVSATVSDPDYLQEESDFILNPNRLNVALSRMKKKLIVLAPKNLFKMIPGEVDEYESSIIWKGLYEEVEAGTDSCKWSGNLSELVEEEVERDIDIEIYTK